MSVCGLSPDFECGCYSNYDPDFRAVWLVDEPKILALSYKGQYRNYPKAVFIAGIAELRLAPLPHVGPTLLLTHLTRFHCYTYTHWVFRGLE